MGREQLGDFDGEEGGCSTDAAGDELYRFRRRGRSRLFRKRIRLAKQ